MVTFLVTVLVCSGCHNKNHRLDSYNKINLFSHSSLGQKSKIKVLAGLVSPELSLSLACRWPSSWWVLTWLFFGCFCTRGRVSFCCLGLPSSSNAPTLASQVTGITGVHHCTQQWPFFCACISGFSPFSYKDINHIELETTLITFHHSNNFLTFIISLKVLSLNTGTFWSILGIRISRYEFWGGTIQSITVTHTKTWVSSSLTSTIFYPDILLSRFFSIKCLNSSFYNHCQCHFQALINSKFPCLVFYKALYNLTHLVFSFSAFIMYIVENTTLNFCVWLLSLKKKKQQSSSLPQTHFPDAAFKQLKIQKVPKSTLWKISLPQATNVISLLYILIYR